MKSLRLFFGSVILGLAVTVGAILAGVLLIVTAPFLGLGAFWLCFFVPAAKPEVKNPAQGGAS